MRDVEDAAGVNTHFRDEGEGAPVVILHGGLEDGSDWDFLAAALRDRHRVLRPDRRGHGATPDVDGPYSYAAMADETVAFLEQVVGGPADLIGFSDGADIALLVGIRHPELVRSLTSISGNLTAAGLLPAMLDRLADPDPGSTHLAPMREAYGTTSPDGIEHWPTFFAKVCAMGFAGPAIDIEDVSALQRPVLVVAADDDVVDHHHTVEIFEALPDARLAIIPGTSHVLAHERPEALVALVDDFLHGDPPRRSLPMRTVSS